jgi:hypothetical protein
VPGAFEEEVTKTLGAAKDSDGRERAPVEGEDFYREGGYIVFTARYHLRRGRCCGSGCRHCPYDEGGGRHEEVAGEGFE